MWSNRACVWALRCTQTFWTNVLIVHHNCQVEIWDHPTSRLMLTTGSHTRLHAAQRVVGPLSEPLGKKKQLHTGFTDGIANEALTTWSYILTAGAIVRLQGNIIHQKSADNDLRCQMCRWFLTPSWPPCLPLIAKRNFFQPPTRLFCCLNVS